LLTLRDEYPDLLRDEASREVEANSYLIDEFLDTLREAGNLDLKFSDLSKRVLFHGHCHQKALVGTAASLNTLRLPPNNEVEEADSGCCGMAGAFGFEREHYEVSMAIGREKLFPAVESKSNDWEIAVTGISCRQQVEHGTNRRPRHLIEVLRDAVL
ncbi:MAG: oxidoreductase, partial [Chloroflexi bacterium]|nr:oxidoreductase [Chloroflexota bacterium]